MTKLPVDVLRDAFEQYLSELRAGLDARCYLGVLHLAAVVPDICAALETLNGQTTGHLYRSWCQRHVRGPATITPAERWQIRCRLLHEGSSLTKGPTYASVSFVLPGQAPISEQVHGKIYDLSDGRNLAIDLEKLVSETVTGLQNWFSWLQQPEQESVRVNVAQLLDRVLSPRPKVIDDEGTVARLNFSSSEFKPAWKMALEE